MCFCWPEVQKSNTASPPCLWSMNCSAMSWAHRHAHGFLGVMLIKNFIYLKAWTKICFIEVAGTFTEGMFFPPCCSLCVQMSMSVNGQASVAPASATTPSGTTPASALWITCRSTEGTTAWVGRLAGFSRLSLSYLGLPATLHFSQTHHTQTWGRATATGTFTLTTERATAS